MSSASSSARTLLLLRHGRTAWNHSGRVQGQLDVDLDEVGLAQAEQAAAYVADLRPTLLWSSDLARTRQTTAALASATGLIPTYDARLREFFFGEREGLTHAEFSERDPDGYRALVAGDYDAVTTAERTVDVVARMVAVLGELLAALGDGETGVAVSHGAAIRVATGAMLDWPDQLFHTLRGLDNCGMVLLGEHPRLPSGAGGLKLMAYNRLAPPVPPAEPSIG